ncbi:organic cation/carnitine transporter 3, partial [Prunus dulcis]
TTWVWSRSDGRIDHDRTIAQFLNPSPRVRDFGVSGLDSRSVDSYTILKLSRVTYLKKIMIQRLNNIEPGNRTICKIRSRLKRYPNCDPRILRSRDNLKISSRHSATSLPSTTRRQRWLSKAITYRRKISKPWLQTPVLSITPYLEPLLFLDLPQKLTGSGRKLAEFSILKSITY